LFSSCPHFYTFSSHKSFSATHSFWFPFENSHSHSCFIHSNRMPQPLHSSPFNIRYHEPCLAAHCLLSLEPPPVRLVTSVVDRILLFLF
jgi:hypothetical protein